MLAGMIPYETASLHIAELTAWASIISAATGTLVVILMAAGIWQMVKANTDRAADRKGAQAAAAEGRKVTQGLLTALERQGAALERLINRTDAVVVELRRHQGPRRRAWRPVASLEPPRTRAPDPRRASLERPRRVDRPAP